MDSDETRRRDDAAGRRAATDGGTRVESTGLRDRLDGEFVRSLPFWLPGMLLVAWFIYGAIGWNLIISLTDFEGFGSADYSTLDFEMYANAVTDPEVVYAAKNTVVLLVAFTAVCLVVGLLLALLVDQKVRFERTFRTTYLLPFSLSFVVTAQVWLWMYNYSSGLMNRGIRAVGLAPPHWIADPQFVLAAVVIAFIWQFSGYAMVVYLAGLAAIPNEHFEAARVDGASTLRTYWRVVIPQLRSSMVAAAVVLMVFALKAFDFLYALFGGYRPKRGADILATKMVREAFQQRQWAYGAAIAILLFLTSLAVISPYLYHQYKRGEL